MITGVQLGMVNLVGAKSDLVCVEPKVEKMSLKESKQKETAKENTLFDFCKGKGLLKQKEE